MNNVYPDVHNDEFSSAYYQNYIKSVLPKYSVGKHPLEKINSSIEAISYLGQLSFDSLFQGDVPFGTLKTHSMLLSVFGKFVEKFYQKNLYGITQKTSNLFSDKLIWCLKKQYKDFHYIDVMSMEVFIQSSIDAYKRLIINSMSVGIIQEKLKDNLSFLNKDEMPPKRTWRYLPSIDEIKLPQYENSLDGILSPPDYSRFPMEHWNFMSSAVHDYRNELLPKWEATSKSIKNLFTPCLTKSEHADVLDVSKTPFSKNSPLKRLFDCNSIEDGKRASLPIAELHDLLVRIHIRKANHKEDYPKTLGELIIQYERAGFKVKH